MRKEDKLKILLVILLIVAVLIWLPNFRGRPKISPTVAQPLDILSLADDFVVVPVLQQTSVGRKSSYIDWGKDPFEGLPFESIKSQSIPVLSGIFWNPRKPSALLNGQVVGVGMKMGPYIVSDIQPSKVVLKDETSTRELTLKE